MSEKKVTVHLGGQDRTLDFGKWYFNHFYGEATGKDPLNTTEILLSPGLQFDWSVNMVYAAMLTDYTANKKKIDFKRGDVQDWLGCMESEDIAGLIKQYVALTNPTEPGEVKSQEENGLPGNN